MNNRSPFLSGPFLTHNFQSQRSQFTRSAGIPGSLFPTMSSTGVPEVALTSRSTRVRERAGVPQPETLPYSPNVVERLSDKYLDGFRSQRLVAQDGEMGGLCLVSAARATPERSPFGFTGSPQRKRLKDARYRDALTLSAPVCCSHCLQRADLWAT